MNRWWVSKVVSHGVRRVQGKPEFQKRRCYIPTMRCKELQSLSDDELLRRLSDLLRQSRRVEAELVAHIGQVDERRLYARHASSMFTYSTEILHLSEHQAYLRIAVARASRRHPVLLKMLADGRLHLSGIAKLAPHLTEANREEVLARATHKTKHQIDEFIAALSPRPDVPAGIRKLPAPRTRVSSDVRPVQLGPDRAGAAPTPSPTPAARRQILEPLAPARYRIQFTASATLRNKLERLQTLMRSAVPDGDLATLFEVLVTEKLERLEAKRFAKTKKPRKRVEQADTSPSSRYIPAPVRRAVRARDGNRCTFVDDNGRRCTETRGLELDHKRPYGRGGDHSVENVRLRCRTHNIYLAERDYGKDLMARYRRGNGHLRKPAPVYTASPRREGIAPIPAPPM